MMNSATDTEIFPGFYRCPDAPRDQEDHYRKYDTDRKFRPQLVAKRDCLKNEGGGKRHRTIDQRR